MEKSSTKKFSVSRHTVTTNCFFLVFIDSTKNNITMVLHKKMRQLEVIINFPARQYSTNLQETWCNDIELFIDYDRTERYFDDYTYRHD